MVLAHRLSWDTSLRTKNTLGSLKSLIKGVGVINVLTQLSHSLFYPNSALLELTLSLPLVMARGTTTLSWPFKFRKKLRCCISESNLHIGRCTNERLNETTTRFNGID